MGRILWYAGVSTALAAGVVVSAFNQRANFYSACVYLAQSNLCLMILINLILFVYGSFMYGLQRLCYGSLRPIEVEQLYEKAWFAITETCLAMTIFREEVGAWFLVMFVALLTGKVWGWIGTGRVEILEQQPPANPRLFHIRLSVSLAMSVIYDLLLMRYTISTVIQQARPNMMVMFLFEFAILTTSSSATALRYCISLVEAKVVKKQTQERLLERRREVREERAELIRQREAAAASAGEGSEETPSTAPLPSEDDVDEMDIEVPGWEAKGHWVLMLDLIKDLVKLGIYCSFFVILLMFYGLPIHIMRDLFLTARSFAKRLAAFLRYRRATHDMNAKYEDATVEDIEREDTCIICREEMRPWSVTNPQAPPAAPGAPPAARPNNVNERSRPKKLPCGHILHLGCLKSWLERQQVCPTCRRPLVDGPQGRNPPGAANNANPAGQGVQPQIPGQQDGQGAQPPAGRPANRGMRMLNFGPLRVGFGQANLQDLAQNLGGAQPGQENAAVGGGARIYGVELGFPRRNQPQPQATATATPAGTNSLQDDLQQIEQHIVAEIRSLQVAQQELQLVQLLQAELARLRLMQNGGTDPLAAANHFQMPPLPQIQPGRVTMPSTITVPQMQRHGVRPNTSAIPASSADLPPGVTIPEGWSLLPLQRLDAPSGVLQTANGTGPAANIAAPQGGLAPTTTTTQTFLSPVVAAGTGSNNTTTTTTPTPTRNPESHDHSQASSVDSSDTNAIHTPPSVTADQSTSSVSAPNTTLPLQSTTTSSNAPEVETEEDTNLLPNWGNSQFFPASSRATPAESTSHNTGGAPPQSSSVEESQASTLAADESTPASAPAPSNEEEEAEERRREKGKARAVMVEDTVDEADGA